MTEKIIEFFAALPDELYVLVVSLLPIVELRGAIPLGAGLGMPFYTNYILSVVGNLLPVPFILLFISALLDFLSKFKLFRPMVGWLRRKADKHSSRVLAEKSTESEEKDAEVAGHNEAKETSESTDAAQDDSAERDDSSAEHEVSFGSRQMTPAIFWALILFVAIPLPGTGAWTGSLVASLFNLPKRKSFIAITAGVLISGVIMCLASYGVVGFLSIFK